MVTEAPESALESAQAGATTRRQVRNEFANTDPMERLKIAGELIASAVRRQLKKSAPEASNDDITLIGGVVGADDACQGKGQ